MIDRAHLSPSDTESLPETLFLAAKDNLYIFYRTQACTIRIRPQHIYFHTLHTSQPAPPGHEQRLKEIGNLRLRWVLILSQKLERENNLKRRPTKLSWRLSPFCKGEAAVPFDLWSDLPEYLKTNRLIPSMPHMDKIQHTRCSLTETSLYWIAIAQKIRS